ncbi:endolytic transglycosylase MltG [Desulfobotulus sp. H1]|uniref:Endolytic murein transglycosylase n=1 Tax=Desulfobotulus pelophilus TaxID=2823377 RepID=A0ABT3NB45_9BACT|nr:endolytic transglycosylase MltG [Desulfobotulus pelophilus]MCW7754685.1 endolytic transglycosylase MltG [Desulfobotulus pelophilus]
MRPSYFFIPFLVLLLLALITGLLLRNELQQYAQTPLQEKGEEILFSVRPGEGFRTVAERMEREGLIHSSFRLRVLARLEKKDTRLHIGTYAMSPALSPRYLLDMMVEGRVKRYRITLPEGLRITEIAKRVSQTGLVEEETFVWQAKDPAFAIRLGITAPTLEGYLFPDTYFFTHQDSVETMLHTMVKHFNRVFTDEKKERAKELGFSVHEIVTLASIIEKETGAPEERPLISSVFHNRLKKGMRLQTDPTVIYGIPDFGGSITRSHLRTPTPYNTYHIRGLPPGPIASPGKASIQAALWPAQSDYLFFVSRNDGTHHFSTNLPEHNRAVQKYQRGNRNSGQ